MVAYQLKRYLLSNNFAILVVALKITSACDLWSFENTKVMKIARVTMHRSNAGATKVCCDERVTVLARP